MAHRRPAPRAVSWSRVGATGRSGARAPIPRRAVLSSTRVPRGTSTHATHFQRPAPPCRKRIAGRGPGRSPRQLQHEGPEGPEGVDQSSVCLPEDLVPWTTGAAGQCSARVAGIRILFILLINGRHFAVLADLLVLSELLRRRGKRWSRVLTPRVSTPQSPGAKGTKAGRGSCLPCTAPHQRTKRTNRMSGGGRER